VTGDSRGILDRILASDIEIGVVGTVPDAAQFEAIPLGSDRVIMVLPRGHRLAGRDSLGCEEIVAEPAVVREEGSGTRAAVMAELAGPGEDPDRCRLNVVLEVGSNESLKAAVRAGVGVAFISELAVKDELESGVLLTRPVEGFDVERAFHLVTRNGAYLGPAARAFKDAALED